MTLVRSARCRAPGGPLGRTNKFPTGDRIQVYRESYALLTQIFEAVVNIQKDYKSIPGEGIKRDCLELVRSVLHANDAMEYSLRLDLTGNRLKPFLRYGCFDEGLTKFIPEDSFIVPSGTPPRRTLP